jgi:hypothetical protein
MPRFTFLKVFSTCSNVDDANTIHQRVMLISLQALSHGQVEPDSSMGFYVRSDSYEYLSMPVEKAGHVYFTLDAQARGENVELVVYFD